MPATLPCPNIANTPPNSGAMPSGVSTRWAARKRTSACFMVSLIVAFTLSRLHRFALWNASRFAPVANERLVALAHQAFERGIVAFPGQPRARCVVKNGAPHGEAVTGLARSRFAKTGDDLIDRRREA